ncbi:MAG: tRNA glutamyl-Q(34) synthetase GluQRS [Thalassobaculum sp.]|uniref:tRNA glutamyl-Q(34) synthetase GluQRS n=1 Tax=Thalassobaculum sp. TaxID=2022740 RepID=UPI0032EDEE92
MPDRSETVVSRFAPSPTGLLHLGHAYSAMLAYDAAHAAGGRFVLRIEDIDSGRCRAEFVDALEQDLAWLGLDWERPVRRQSEHMDDYRAALDRLQAMDLLYPCFLSRRELDAALSAPHFRAMRGPEGPAVVDADRLLPAAERAARMAAGEPYALRLRMAAALALAGPLTWQDEGHGTQAADPAAFGDVVLARKDIPTSYHLAVTVDDALQGITLVVRGEDLFQATHVHRLLQALLGLPTPRYRHHRLLTDSEGRRYAKRDRALTLRALREAGRTPADVRAIVGL